MSAQGVRAGRAYVEIGANDASLVRGLRRAQARLEAFGAGVRSIGLRLIGAGAALSAPFGLAIREFERVGSQLKDVSERTGVGTDKLQEYAYAAGVTGATLENVEKAMAQAAKNATAAADGSKQAADGLRDVGLSAAQVRDMKPDELFDAILAGLSAIPDPARRTATAMALLGRTGRAMIPMATQAAKLRDEWRKLGAQLSARDIDLADELGDKWKAARLSVTAAASAVGAALAPSMIALAERTSAALRETAAWINKNRQVVVVAAQVAKALVATGAALVAVGVAATLLGKVLGVAAAVLSVLLTPVGALIALALALASAFGVLGPAVEAAGRTVTSWFAQMRATAEETVGGVVDALAAGDLAAAAEIAGAGLLAAFIESTQGIRTWWIEVTTGLQAIWAQGTAFIRSSWAQTVDWIRSAFDGVGDWLAKRWNDIVGLFDSSFDAVRANADIDAAAQDRAVESAAELDAQLKQIAADEDAALASIGDSGAARLSAAQDALAAAKQKLADLRKAAGDRRAAIDTGVEPAAPDLTAPALALAASTRKVSSAGTFSAAAAFGLAGGPLNNIEKRADEGVRLLRRIDENTADSGSFT